MRYSEAHAAKSGSVPCALRGPKSVRMALATAVAGAIGLVPAVAVSTPALAIGVISGVTITPSTASVTEGDTLNYTVKYTGTDPLSLTVAVAGAGNPASTADYNAPASTLAFTGAATKTIAIKTTDDTLYELTENLTVTISDGSNTETANGTIYDNDNQPSYTLTAAPATVNEGKTDGTVTSKITATLNAKAGVDVKITLKTEDGTAKATTDVDYPKDYTALNGGGDGTITIPAGELTASATVEVNNDLVKDTSDNENFKVKGTADCATPSDASTSVNIVDAQTTPVLSL